MNKLKFIRRKHICIKLCCFLLLVLASLLLTFLILKGSSPLFLVAGIFLEVIAFIFFVLSLLTKTIKYTIGKKTLYLSIGIFFHYLTSRHHVLDKTVTFWFGIHSLYFEFDHLEIEAKIGTFQKPTLTANNEIVKPTK